MKSTFIIRKVDGFGITIPRIIRDQLDIKHGDQFEFFIDNEKNIVLKKVVTEPVTEDVKVDNEDLVSALVARAFSWDRAEWLAKNDIELAKHLAYDNVPESEIDDAHAYMTSKGVKQQSFYVPKEDGVELDYFDWLESNGLEDSEEAFDEWHNTFYKEIERK